MSAVDKAPDAALLPWLTHNPGDLTSDRLNVICPVADVVILENIESVLARLIAAEHNDSISHRAVLAAPSAPAEVDPPDVRCNGCDWHGYDDDLVASIDSEDGEPSRPCPNCGTDENLMDIPAPAKVEGLVERFDIYLDDFDQLTKMPSADGEWMLYADHDTALTELQAEIERMRSLHARDQAHITEQANKLRIAEAEVARLKSNTAMLHEALDEMVLWHGVSDKAIAAFLSHAKLKGEV